MQTVSVNYTCVWQHKEYPEYQWTKDGACINAKTGRLLGRKYQSGTFGYNIRGKFVSLQKLRPLLVKITKSEVPF